MIVERVQTAALCSFDPVRVKRVQGYFHCGRLPALTYMSARTCQVLCCGVSKKVLWHSCWGLLPPLGPVAVARFGSSWICFTGLKLSLHTDCSFCK